MDDAVRARDAAREVLDDIEPERLREVLFDRLADTSMTPAVLTLLSARALDPDMDADAVETGSADHRTNTGDTDGIAQQAAGVQLIYEGLRLTRSLAHDVPWTTMTDDKDTAEGTPASSQATPDDIAADLDVLAADVLVSRGFYLLARTDAATRAVEVVRAFGRDQTHRRAEGADTAALDRNLEADIFALAVLTGTTAVGGEASPALLDFATDLGRECDVEDGLVPAATAFSEATTDRIASLSAVESGSDDRVPSSATDR
ncbi:DUF7114 family protein [Halopelagius longus]|uniref:Polyprenyl synthetase n=1 Tax=Halopelagius longus TaxID=1236180 RepID=A0A1H0XTW4_9EURY|nr:hypothetical protein [Halopelagius longus]RDI72088.1 hypothetical protein DWB78_10370 [Halopelagius longus]SDQ06289.1 hypothetical protein SAMN05216278_0181 [Halopelagius longus]